MTITDRDNLIEGLRAAIQCAKLALFVIRKQGVMPNSSWESGFNSDLAKAEKALAALTAAAQPYSSGESQFKRGE